MANMMGRSRFPIDAALILRDQALAVLSAVTNLASQPLVSKGAYWQNPADAHDGVIYVVGHVESLAGGTLSIDIYSAEDATGTNKKLQASFPVVSDDRFELPVDQISLLKRHPAATNWFVELNVGSGASAGVFCYLAPDWD